MSRKQAVDLLSDNITNAYVVDVGVCGSSEECGVMRFIYVVVSSGIALCGCSFNTLLVAAFVRSNSPDTPSTLYPSVLAVLDAFICLFYILLFGVDVAAIYLRIEVRLFRAVLQCTKSPRST